MLGTGGWDILANMVSGFCPCKIWVSGESNKLRDDAKDFQYGVFPYPLPPNGQQRTALGGWAFVANAKGKIPGSGKVLRGFHAE